MMHRSECRCDTCLSYQTQVAGLNLQIATLQCELVGMRQQAAQSDVAKAEKDRDAARSMILALANAAESDISMVTKDRDRARAIARVLAHAYAHDSRPPEDMVKEALAFPAQPGAPQ